MRADAEADAVSRRLGSAGSRGSPPTDRVKGILTLLAGSERPLTLTEIARALSMSISTCQAVLTSLADGGFVVRSGTRTYVLGPALIRLGQAARAMTPMSAVVEAELEALHARIGLGCAAFAVVNEQLVLISRAGPSPLFPVQSMAVGPFPLVAPFGATIIASRGEEAVELWLGGAADLDRALHLRQLLETIATLGFSVSISTAETRLALPRFDRLLRELEDKLHSRELVSEVLQLLALSGSRGYLEEELRSGEPLSVTLITAPVVVDHVAVEVHVHVYRSAMTWAEVEAIGASLLGVCRAIAERVSGRAVAPA